jgi:hypothetical protein
MSNTNPIATTPITFLKQNSIASCPHVIWEPSHYRSDGSCRCNDGSHKEMGEWGYKWDGSAWIAPADND